MRGQVLSTYAVPKLLIVPVVAAILGLVACDGLVIPLPSDAVEFSPPTVYSTWWKMTQVCSGKTGSLGAVTWFKTDQALRHPQTGEPLVGFWTSGSNRIVLRTDAVLEGGAVRHEMLHALVRQPGHARNQFLGNCAGLVDCQETCSQDAGPYPQPPETPIDVPGDSIDITVAVEPGNPNSALDGGVFSITVLVRNRSSRWVTVPSFYSTIFPGHESRRTFQFDVRGPAGGITGGELRFDPSQWIFAPGEIKKQVFDFAIGNDLFAHKLPPGDYIARGGYSDYWSTDRTFAIGP